MKGLMEKYLPPFYVNDEIKIGSFASNPGNDT
jgi:hypothetical protein